ncbi:DUF262 domain-containing protein [Mycoplasma sp. OR1901]|uniref:GmrSD restriction endonuclease domain-containing protein n=1 Tax=Mycoplasma sp. OR1901 TaxID=2742195 RepID=UPI0015828185|nr:DUF262 domain-containing protein [Mycoplasma sp. OR1901]QKT05417.1 DUF262 domain-containing protein [Mycoplasma sp. OR1901]
MKKINNEMQKLLKDQGVDIWVVGTDVSNYLKFFKNDFDRIKRYLNDDFLVKIVEKNYGDNETNNYSLKIIDSSTNNERYSIYQENLSLSTYNQIINFLLGLKILNVYKNDNYKFNSNFSRILKKHETWDNAFKEYIRFYLEEYSKPYLFDVIDNVVFEERALLTLNKDVQVVRILTNIYAKFNQKEGVFLDHLMIKAKNLEHFTYFYNEYFDDEVILDVLTNNLSSFFETHEIKDNSWVKKNIEDYDSWNKIYSLVRELGIKDNAVGELVAINSRESDNLKPMFAHLFSLGEILNDATKFYIPSFQRVYMWNGYLVEELVGNIISSMNNQNSTNKEQYAFFNNIILSFGNNYAEILDGQQRLMTFIILLTVLLKLSLLFLDHFKNEDGIMHDPHYQNLILFKDFYSKVVYRRRIQELGTNLETGDSDNFNTIHDILGDFNSKANNNYINNAIELSKVISSKFLILDHNGLRKFSQFVIFTLKNVKFTTTIFTDIANNATEKINIFRNINLHSKELSVLDLVKSSLITHFDSKSSKDKGLKIDTIVNLNKNIFDKYFRKEQKETKDADMNLLELFYNSIYVSNNWFAKKRSIEDRFSISKNSIIYNKFEEFLSKTSSTWNESGEEFYFIFFKHIVNFEFSRVGNLNNIDNIVNKIKDNGLEKEQILWFNNFKKKINSFPILSTQILNLTNDGNTKVFTPLIYTILSKFNFFENEVQDIKYYIDKISKLIYEMERFGFLWKNIMFAGESLGKKIIELSKIFLEKGELYDINQVDEYEFEAKLKTFRNALFKIHPELNKTLYINPETGEYKSNELLREKISELYNNKDIEKLDIDANTKKVEKDKKILMLRLNSFILNKYNKFDNEFLDSSLFVEFQNDYSHNEIIKLFNIELNEDNFKEIEVINILGKIGNYGLIHTNTIKSLEGKKSKNSNDLNKVSENNLVLLGDYVELDKHLYLSRLNSNNIDELTLLDEKFKINSQEVKLYLDNINKRSEQLVDIIMKLYSYKG